MNGNIYYLFKLITQWYIRSMIFTEMNSKKNNKLDQFYLNVTVTAPH